MKGGALFFLSFAGEKELMKLLKSRACLRAPDGGNETITDYDGRAREGQAFGQGFDSPQLHKTDSRTAVCFLREWFWNSPEGSDERFFSFSVLSEVSGTGL